MFPQPYLPPTFEISGFHLRPLKVTDADALFDYLRDPIVTDLTSYPGVSPGLAEAIIARSCNRWALGEPGKWGICQSEDDRLVGTCGFNEWSSTHRWAELGYDLASPYWGRGLMGQAVTEVVGWAFQNHLIDRVHAYVRVDNQRSFRLLERVGFVREGCLRELRLCRGRRFDFYVYGLLRTDRPIAKG